MDIMGGIGWRQPLMSHKYRAVSKPPRWAVTALIQGGTTWSQLKNVTAVDDSHYRTSDHNRWVPASKLTVGIEYVFSPDFNIFLNVAYYRTPRGFHERSINSGQGWNPTTMLSHWTNDIYAYADEVKKSCLLVHGDKAWSYQQSVLMMARLTNAVSKELVTIPDATHCDLYDGGNDKVIPFDNIESFLRDNLK